MLSTPVLAMVISSHQSPRHLKIERLGSQDSTKLAWPSKSAWKANDAVLCLVELKTKDCNDM